MYKLCKTEQSARRQRQLELGLLRAMLTQRYEDISVSDLCDRMGVPRKSFYRYFSSKDGCLYALLDHTMMEFYEEGLRSPEGGTQMGDLDQFFVFWQQHETLLKALKRSSLSGILVERATILAQRERLIPQDLQSLPEDLQAMATAFSICGLMSMVIQWHDQGYTVTAQRITEIAKAMLTQPLIKL